MVKNVPCHVLQFHGICHTLVMCGLVCQPKYGLAPPPLLTASILSLIYRSLIVYLKQRLNFGRKIGVYSVYVIVTIDMCIISKRKIFQIKKVKI